MKKTILFSTMLTALVMVFSTCNHNNGGGGHVIKNAVTDVDGNKYNAVKIGDQTWMQSNLRTKHFRDGSAIEQGTDNISAHDPLFYQPTTQVFPAYDEKTHGLLYNWKAATNEKGICPEGWHLPSDAEWTQLEEYVSNQSEYVYDDDSRHIAKSLASTVGWNEAPSYHEGHIGNNPEANNATGFSAVPAGMFQEHVYGSFGSDAVFWTATNSSFSQAYNRDLYYDSPNVMRLTANFNHGFSVRCVKD